MPKYKQQKVVIRIDKKHNPQERQLVAREIIEFIQSRTGKGFDKNGKRFKGYKKSYTQSKTFKESGKSISPVDLVLSGEMMNNIKLLTHRSGSVTVGYDKNDNELNGKVEGNRLGTYGNKKPVQKPRDFLGIAKTPLSKIENDVGEQDG